MWARPIRVWRYQICQSRSNTFRFSRSYNGATQQGPYKTYFQDPPQPVKPPRRIFRTVLWSTTCFALGAYAYSWVFANALADVEEIELAHAEDEEAHLHETLVAGAADVTARQTPALTAEQATALLTSRAAYSVTPTAVSHNCQSPSNLPCEDTWSSGRFTFFNDAKRDWCEWAVFDGHAGPRTAQLLKEVATSFVAGELWEAGCLDQPYIPNDWHTVSVIKKAFLDIDHEIVEEARKSLLSDAPRAEVIAKAAAAFSGSCALMALFDPMRSVLRVANVGDSRAILGRWDSSKNQYVAKPMSVDQTGFNSDEVARIEKEHPDETVVDPNTGRIHGMAVSRAFGDARWKWVESVNKMAHDTFWGPKPRPEGLIKTPPYLTAEPEVTDVRIQTGGGHPDFLIMASDGLWDLMTSEDAVTCVQMWLEKFKPTNFLENQTNNQTISEFLSRNLSGRGPTSASDSDTAEIEDLYFSESEQLTRWRVGPKHFIVEDKHCGVHLIKNALGGKRRELFTGIMSLQPPLSRDVRDDITVVVIFFGVDGESAISH